MAAEKLGLTLNYEMGLPGRGIAQQVTDGSWPGPGIVYKSRFEEGVQRNLFRFYAEMMRTPQGTYPSLVFSEQAKNPPTPGNGA